jgi:hypothetical protein
MTLVGAGGARLLLGLALALPVASLSAGEAEAVDPQGDHVVAAAGDIVCDPADPRFNGLNPSFCQHRTTDDLIINDSTIDNVLTLGDEQYNEGSLADFQTAYEPTWGAFKDKTNPVPGDEEYETPGAQGYFDYFGAAAHPETSGWYSFNLGSWHIVALNSNCNDIPPQPGTNNGCAAGSPQEIWLRNDLAADSTDCTLAYMHLPRFSSSGGSGRIGPLVKALYQDDAELLLGGHKHNERFAPQTPGGQPNADEGIVQFVVGTGGRGHKAFGTNIRPNSLVRNSSAFGVLKLTLRDESYDWNFVSTDNSFGDGGSASCHD